MLPSERGLEGFLVALVLVEWVLVCEASVSPASDSAAEDGGVPFMLEDGFRGSGAASPSNFFVGLESVCWATSATGRRMTRATISFFIVR